MPNGRPIAYASRALTETETRYAQIEKEMLAIAFSLEKFHRLSSDGSVQVESDHKPLEAILQNGFWSLSTWTERPNKNWQNFSSEETMANISFSI